MASVLDKDEKMVTNGVKSVEHLKTELQTRLQKSLVKGDTW
jgi:hypothetical protein